MGQRRSFSREEPETRRRALIEALLRCLARHGHGGSSVRIVAAEADVSPGLIRHHFGEKNQLLAEAYRHLADQLLSHLKVSVAAAPPDARARLRAFAKAGFTAPAASHDHVTARFVLWSIAMTDPTIRAVSHRIDSEYRSLAHRLLANFAGNTDGGDVGALTGEFVALLNGLWLEWSLGRDDVDADVFADRSLAFVERRIAHELS